MLVKNVFKKVIALTGAIVISSTTVFLSDISYPPPNQLNMSSIYSRNSSLYSAQVEKTQNSLEVISPNYFNVNEDGSLKLTEAIDKKFIKEMHNKNMKVIPFLSNHWDRELGRLALKNKKELVEDICEAIEEYDLDGINLDLENLTEEDRDSYTKFVRLMRRRLPSDKVVSVAVAPNPYNFKKGWQASFDYELLSKYSDFLVIMTYDESYPGGPSGPVASLGFVEDSIKYTLEKAPNEKIVLGIPFYGRLWDESGEIRGYGISIKKVEELLNKYESEIIYDVSKQSAMATIYIKDDDERPYLVDRKLDPGKYTIWYENNDSIKSKLRLVQKYDLMGAASWSLGQENKDVWNYYNLWLNGQYFEDIVNHWAGESILRMENKGWMKGTSDTTFSPNEPLTRAQGAAILVRALDLKEKKGSFSGFNDMENDHWAKKEIDIACQYGIIEGYEDGGFKPERPITREEMAVMLDRILEEHLKDGGNKLKYNDIDYSRWSYDAISKMTYNSILKGFEDNTFRPIENITRGQMAALMDRIALYIED